MWNGDKTPVLTSGWMQFVADYGLLKTSDFVTDGKVSQLEHVFIRGSKVRCCNTS
ncbi:B3 domain-containing protein [Arabidopsis thaliana]